jgi:hypothetical protein
LRSTPSSSSEPVLPHRALFGVHVQSGADFDRGLKKEAHQSERHDAVGLRARIVLVLRVVDDVVSAGGVLYEIVVPEYRHLLEEGIDRIRVSGIDLAPSFPLPSEDRAAWFSGDIGNIYGSETKRRAAESEWLKEKDFSLLS